MLFKNDPPDESQLACHVDEGDEEVRGAVLAPLSSIVSTIQNPFDENHDNEVAKKTKKEAYLRKELKNNGMVLSLAHLVPHTQNHPKSHMNHSKYERNLHFISIQELDTIGSCQPYWVNS